MNRAVVVAIMWPTNWTIHLFHMASLAADWPLTTFNKIPHWPSGFTFKMSANGEEEDYQRKLRWNESLCVNVITPSSPPKLVYLVVSKVWVTTYISHQLVHPKPFASPSVRWSCPQRNCWSYCAHQKIHNCDTAKVHCPRHYILSKSVLFIPITWHSSFLYPTPLLNFTKPPDLKLVSSIATSPSIVLSNGCYLQVLQI